MANTHEQPQVEYFEDFGEAPKLARRYCRECDKWTDFERAETLPAEYRTPGDDGYFDTAKCGKCGEEYVCDECGAPVDEQGECESVLTFGAHGHRD